MRNAEGSTGSATSGLVLELAVITSITRDGRPRAVRRLTNRAAVAGQTKPVDVDRLQPHALRVVPAAQMRVNDALAAIQARRADADTGEVASYTSPVELLRDLHPWVVGPVDCLAILRAAAVVEVRDDRNQRCSACGVATYGDGRIVIADDGCPTAYCAPGCPIGVNFATDYPVGLEVIITQGFAAGAIGSIERVSDAYPPDLDGTRYYAGRAYVMTLPYWGERQFTEDIVEPRDAQLVDRYAVRRGTSTA
ncbi:hypothetical protein ACQP2F_33310 [Actinoplanes sp. CA-030573]|uniref:hypothetical protein n=1 Tax=Actinoplanes sp. CA-030573 TaxID=3239898 RepID=UPI003D9001FF